MLHTRTAIEYGDETRAAMMRAIVEADVAAEVLADQRNRLSAERAMDEVLADSFPASDPPSWNPGIALPYSASHLVTRGPHDEIATNMKPADVVRTGIIDVSRAASRERTFIQTVVSLAGAAGIALLVPFAVLLVGLPVVLFVRGVIEVVGWLFAFISP